jgi:CheY-like chemotaxis protein
MKKLLIIDDDEALRSLYRKRLSSLYEIVESGEPEQAVALALEHKPDAIVLDLRMPKFDGFELCRNFRSLTYTSNLPIFVVTGQSGSYQKECEAIGVSGFLEKPIDFARLKQSLAAALGSAPPKRREEMPLQMRVSLKLRGTDGQGEQFSDLVSTERVSHEGFQFTSPRDLSEGSMVDVFLTGSSEHRVGHARIVDRCAADLQSQTYRALFDGTADWIFRKCVRSPEAAPQTC